MSSFLHLLLLVTISNFLKFPLLTGKREHLVSFWLIFPLCVHNATSVLSDY